MQVNVNNYIYPNLNIISESDVPFKLPWIGNFMFNDKSSKDYTIQIQGNNK